MGDGEEMCVRGDSYIMCSFTFFLVHFEIDEMTA